MNVQGKLSGDSGWAVARKARLSASAGGVSIAPEQGPPVQVPWSAVKLKASLMDEAETILEARTEDGHAWSFEGPSSQLLGVVRANTPPGSPLHVQASAVDGTQTVVRRGRSRQMRVVLLIFGILIGMVVGALWYLPTYVANHFPPAWEDHLGRTTVSSVANQGKVLEKGPAYDAVHKVWDRLAPGLPPSPYHPKGADAHGYTIFVVDDDVVNAFAAPGGYVVVYTGLLRELDSPEALAGILGHEANHVLLKHSVKSLVRSVSWQVAFSLGWALFGGDKEAASLQTLHEMAQNMDSLAYSRAHESESDIESVKALVKAGIDPIPFTNFFKTLSKREGPHLAILSTHPPSDDRAATLQAFAKTLEPYKSTPIDIDWKAMQNSLGPRK